ncbi:GH92 family glycosyl hydrolase [Algoriphagus sp. NG3]|uniref:GH92 family glycosyl hydrolase n=1 Tax=Algoriphagus sp. NG3 TaxID=3097546 RepID=UPI002A80A85A|nr:GH92 family glycosyl hydrolase [Algoriphagus sp. NG3]WPR77355.1 GH92 family glycosyl hydrolase [Algoriphagus sp. NG3]
MRKLICSSLLLFNILLTTVFAQEPLKSVDPLIGTAHARYFHFAPGAMPFGMAKPAPSTNGSLGNKSGWEATGYDYRDSSIENFPNFHEFQIGGVALMATTGVLQTIPGNMDEPSSGYRSSFDRKDEVAQAGYYSVLLKDYGITAELTSTERVAFHRYTFPQSEQSHILFDIGNMMGESGKVKDAEVKINPDGTVEGYVVTAPVYVEKYQAGADIRMYFYAVPSKQAPRFGVFQGEQITNDVTKVNGISSGAFFTYSTKKNEAIELKIGLSYTSVDAAKANYLAEAEGLDFDSAKKRNQKTWNSMLGRIKVEGGKDEDRTKFYTGLYHALLGRGLASDITGTYPKNDGSVGQIALAKNGKPVHHHYNTDAIWGAFWNLTQVWAIAYPEYLSEFVNSQLLVYKDSGWLADGIANSKYVSGVGTNFVSLVIASAYLQGIRDFDVALGYEAALKNELEGRDRPRGAGKLDVDRFVKNGFVPHIDESDNEIHESWMFSASHTMEYSFSSYAVGQFAKALGKTEDYEKLNKLSDGWKHLFDPELKLIRPKSEDGTFVENFNPSQAWRGFQEGNSYQYTFYVPHDAKGLIDAIGKDKFNIRLDSIFIEAEPLEFGGGKTIDAFSGLEGMYNQGNQPNLHVAWMFNYSGKPSLTQKWIQEICNKFYGTEGIHGYGYGQDEDQGQLGAWYVLGAIGLFDVAGLTKPEAKMGLSSPLFDKVTIALNPKYYQGKEFVIKKKIGKATGTYIEKIMLNNKAVHEPFIPLEAITSGGKLELEMGNTPKDSYN